MKISLTSDINRVQSVTSKNIENKDKDSKECSKALKESTMDLQYSRPEAVTYNARGGYRKNSHNMIAKHNDVCDCKRPEFQPKPNLTGAVSTSPRVPVKAVVKMSMGDIIRLDFNACSKPLSDHVQESGKDATKRYVVIDGVRYESDIPESERCERPKTLIEILFEADKERMEHKKKHKDNEYELAGMPESSIAIGASRFTAYGTIDERTGRRIEEVLSSIF